MMPIEICCDSYEHRLYETISENKIDREVCQNIKDMHNYIKGQKYAEPDYRMKGPEGISKKERWVKLSLKIEEDTVFKRLKDGQKHIRNPRMGKRSERLKYG
jgi:hypothetical protein